MLLLWALVLVLTRSTYPQTVTQQSNTYPIYWSLVPTTPPAVVNTQTNTFGSCICKTLVGQCTPNCCCDTDCDTDTLNSFTTCLPETASVITSMKCVSSTTVVISRLPQSLRSKTTSTTPNPLFCVYYDSSPVYGSYYNFVSDMSKVDLNSLMATESWKNIAPQRIIDDVTISTNLDSYYKVGDNLPVAIMSSSNVLAIPSYNYLRIPSEVFSSTCSDNVFAQYLKSTPWKSCNRVITNISNSCAGIFNATMLLSLYVAIAPTITADIQNFKSITVRNVTTDTSNSTLHSIPASVVSASGDCQNALTRTAFIITYDVNNISKVEVDLWLTTVAAGTNFLTQYTSLTFVKGSSSNYEMGLMRNVSGNPGYVRGSPIVAGSIASLTQGTSTLQAIKQTVSGFTLYRGDDCSQMLPTTVTFDQDMISSCRLTLTLAQLKTICTNNDIPILAQVDSLYTYFGRFGDASLYNINEWVLMQQADGPTATWDDTTSTCNALAAGTQYEFVIAQQGSTNNGQWKIAGVRRYRFPQKWKFNTEDPSITTRPFWVQWRVRFVHLNGQSSGKSVAPIPNLLPQLPEDVFYPFTLSSSAIPKASWLLVVICTTLLL